jgi:hypothetical protein
VEAGRPGAGYRLRKLARRYRGPLLTAAAVAVLLVAATALSMGLAVVGEGATAVAVGEGATGAVTAGASGTSRTARPRNEEPRRSGPVSPVTEAAAGGAV